MTGKDIVNHITQAEMPDRKQVYDTCAKQLQTRSHPRRVRWSVAAAVVTVCFLFACTSYAVGLFNLRSLDTGGSVEFIIREPSEHIPRWRGWQGFNVPIYFNRLNPITINERRNWTTNPTCNPMVNEYAAQLINEALEGLLFTYDGLPFEGLMVYMSPEYTDRDRTFAACDRGQPLFNKHGQEIGLIQCKFEHNTDLPAQPMQVLIRTVAGVERFHRLNFTLEYVTEVLGRDFRLPTAHIDGYDPPRFILATDALHDVVNDDGTVRRVQIAEPEWVGVRFSGHSYFTSMYINVEPVRGAYDELWVIFLRDGTIMEFATIGSTTVHKVTAPNGATQFWWTHDGLVYALTAPRVQAGTDTSPCGCNEPSCYVADEKYAFTCEEIKIIIRSMVE